MRFFILYTTLQSNENKQISQFKYSQKGILNKVKLANLQNKNLQNQPKDTKANPWLKKKINPVQPAISTWNRANPKELKKKKKQS